MRVYRLFIERILLVLLLTSLQWWRDREERERERKRFKTSDKVLLIVSLICCKQNLYPERNYIWK